MKGYTFTTTAAAGNAENTVVMTLTFVDGLPVIVHCDPLRGHERELGIRAALRYLAGKGKPWRGELP